MKKRKVTAVLSVILAVAMLAGCGKTEETEEAAATSTPTPTEEVTETPTPTPEEAIEAEAVESELEEGQMYSYLTGEIVDESIGTQRPFAVMINNLQPAVPQSGTSNAEIMYECLVEGGITRLLAIIQDPSTIEKIGPIRSARHYYIDLAMDNEGIFTHFGWSIFAQARIEDNNLEHINGQVYDGNGNFFRTSDRVAPHNAYATGTGLIATAESLGYSRDYPEDYTPNLLFNTSDTPLTDGTEALKVNIPFDWNDPYFVYNEEDGLYYRWEYDAEHTDMENGEQLSFKNIIVQYATYTVISDSDHQDIALYTEGNGLYITDGKAIEITWVKTGEDDNTKYYDSDGNQLVMNQGKTMIEVVPDTSTVTFG